MTEFEMVCYIHYITIHKNTLHHVKYLRQQQQLPDMHGFKKL